VKAQTQTASLYILFCSFLLAKELSLSNLLNNNHFFNNSSTENLVDNLILSSVNLFINIVSVKLGFSFKTASLYRFLFLFCNL
jgi:hypothetical protein